MNKLYVSKVKDNAIIPTKSEEDAGYDLYSNFNETELIIKPKELKLM